MLNTRFQEVAKPLMEFLSENYHPHVQVILCSTHAEMLEGLEAFRTEEFIKD